MKPPTSTVARSDEALLAAFVAGERDALGELARRHEAALLGLARGLLGGDGAQARDAVQNAWVRVIRHGRSFRGRSSFKTWVYRITVNECRRRAPGGAAAARSGNVDDRDAGMSDGPALRQERSDELRRAVAALSERKREVLLLCHHAELTHEQAAGILRIPVGTVKSRLHAALGDLRARLAPDETTREIMA